MSRQRTILLIALFGLIQCAPFYVSALDVIVTTKPGGSKSDIAAVLKIANTSTSRPVFSPDERRMLIAAGRANIAAAVKLTLTSERALNDLDWQIRRQRLPIALERAEIEFHLNSPATQQSDEQSKAPLGSSFEKLQWALANIGQSIPIAIDDMTSLFVKGTVGEDLGIARAPKESMDPKRRITIAVVDTGVDFGHPEMLDRVVENTSECRAIAELTKCRGDAEKLASPTAVKSAKTTCDTKYVGKDFDGNGYPLDCSGWNVTAKSLIGDNVWGDADARDFIGHGTHVAGIIAARGDDGDGIRGVSENVRILPVKVITAAPSAPVRVKEVAPNLTGVPKPSESSLNTEKGLGDLVARGLLYAIRSGANIVNMSLGWPADVDSNLMQQMIELATARGILMVAAAGNDGTDALIRPCVFEGMICVASHDPDGAISHFSNHGPGVDIAAPGLNILSIFPTALNPRIFTDRVGYEIKSGTSMAAPYIAGLLGRLLNAGFSPMEARARLLVGTRPVTTNARVQRARDMIVQTGSADLGRAFTVTPRPLIGPISKRPVEIEWDRRSPRAKFKIKLENSWTDASSVSITMSVTNNSVSGTLRDASVQPNVLVAQNWKSGEIREFELDLLIHSPRIESELLAEITIIATDARTGLTTSEKRYVALEVTATPTSSDPEIETRKIVGDTTLIADLAKSKIRSVFPVDGRTDQDYVVMLTSETGLRVSLLQQQAKEFRFIGSTVLPATEGTLLLVQRVDLNNDNSSDYVMIWKKNPTAEKRTPTFLFRFFDSQFQPLAQSFDGKSSAEAEYSNSVSVINDTFQWISDGNRKVPAWISRGTTPESEKQKYDPWNPNPLDLPDFRLYYWGKNGLATLSLKDKFPIAFLPASRAEMKSGLRQVLWTTGEGTEAVYETSTVDNLKTTISSPISLGGFRKLRSSMMAPILNLNGRGESLAGETIGVGLYGESYRSALRVSGFVRNMPLLFDETLNPLSKIDAVTSVLAAYSGQKTKAILAQTIYEMVYRDLNSGKMATASLKRFSFMPDFYFEKLYRGVIGDDSGNPTERLPMVYLAQGFGTGSTLEILAPRYEFGTLEGLVRPARLRLKPPVGCQAMGDTVAADALAPTKVVFACHDRIVFVPLKY